VRRRAGVISNEWFQGGHGGLSLSDVERGMFER
jgi:hypothetical protein